jgi:exopolyphosphatase/guanosine-5'-triphosphate,3'-diphosphate pyrophosphatase
MRLPGMREDRKAIIGGGLSVVRALFKLLGIHTLQMASGGLRHGLICDLLGANENNAEDLRLKSVRRLAGKFNVDLAHGERVSKTAVVLFEQLEPLMDLSESERQRLVRKLDWAARLHEIGSHISHSDYHKHGAYILDNADAIGFSLSEMHRLSILVLGHRGKLRKVETALIDDTLAFQLVALRLAVILCHARRDPDLSGIALSRPDARRNILQLNYRDTWATAFPQSAHLLREEAVAWQKTDWTLEVVATTNNDLPVTKRS